MASISRSRPVPHPRSGGKILRPRRTATTKTPYHRSNPSPQSPNWLSRFVFSTTRSIATGVGKLFLSVLDLQSSATSSSSSSSEKIDTSNDENDTPFQSGDALKKAMNSLLKTSDGDVVKVNGNDDSDGVNHHLNSVEETREASDSRLHDGSCSVFKEKVKAENAMANSSKSSGSRCHAEQDIERNDKTSDNKESTVNSDHKRIEKDVPERETDDLLNETFLELPDLNFSNIVAMDEDDGVVTASENSSRLPVYSLKLSTITLSHRARLGTPNI